MANTFSPDPDREELDLVLRGFRVSGMLSRSLIYGSRTKSQPTATSWHDRPSRAGLRDTLGRRSGRTSEAGRDRRDARESSYAGDFVLE